MNLLAEMEGFQNDQIINPPLTPPVKNQEIETSSDSVPNIEIIDKVEDKSQVENIKKNREQKKKTIEAAITYFRNNNEKNRMNYWESVAVNHPIGSGVTEAACKTIVKQRLCLSGMRWKDKGAGVILSLRALSHSTGRWEQFWQKVNQFGFPIAA